MAAAVEETTLTEVRPECEFCLEYSLAGHLNKLLILPEHRFLKIRGQSYRHACCRFSEVMSGKMLYKF